MRCCTQNDGSNPDARTKGPDDEYKTLRRAHWRSGSSRDWLREFIRRMRLKYPDMPLTYEEQKEAGVEKLRKDLELQRRVDLIRDNPITTT